MLKFIKNKISKLDHNTIEVVNKSSYSLMVKIFTVVLGLALSVFLGRVLSVSDFGIINLSNRIIQVLIVFCLFGMRQVIIKIVAIDYNSKNTQETANIMFTAYIFNGVISILISIVFILISDWLSVEIFKEPKLRWPLTISIIALTPQIFSRVFSGALVGYRRIWQSNLVDNTLSTLITIIILSAFYLLNYEINIINVSIIYALSRLFVMLVVGTYWYGIFQNQKKEKTRIILPSIFKNTLSLFMVSITSMIFLNADAIMLGWLGNVRMVGLYTVAAKIATLTIFFMQVTNTAISPKLAHLFAENKINQLERMTQSITLGLTVIALITLTFIIVFGKFALGLWGNEFEEAYLVLIILSIGQFFNIATGASGAILMMCGLQHEYAKLSLFLVVLNLVLNYFLIKYYGIIGAAIATSVIVFLDNISRVVLAKKKLNILIIPIPRSSQNG
ncbi:oligosaccharide flippase family protein [Namhaeicola litoreus]|uniref:Oligosaccharide flippase family protein n=1 Tax=Namhaeicola litoreus TaxID=1052145 RepID=A0ABW3Y4Q7_9FLAO